MATSQVANGAAAACTTIALYTLNEILANPAGFNTENFFNECIIKGSEEHLKKYTVDAPNLYVNEAMKNTCFKKLTNKIAEITYDPQLNEGEDTLQV